MIQSPGMRSVTSNEKKVVDHCQAMWGRVSVAYLMKTLQITHQRAVWLSVICAIVPNVD